jgi:hypothetical protein
VLLNTILPAITVNAEQTRKALKLVICRLQMCPGGRFGPPGRQYSFGIYFSNLFVPRLDEFDRTLTPLNTAIDRYGLRTHPSAGDD